ncbi:hypothetical protein A5N45_12410, partial [Streptococcus pneumoniae]
GELPRQASATAAVSSQGDETGRGADNVERLGNLRNEGRRFCDDRGNRFDCDRPFDAVSRPIFRAATARTPAQGVA